MGRKQNGTQETTEVIGIVYIIVIKVTWWLEQEGWEQVASRCILKVELTGIGRGLGMKRREEEESG